ncbi:type II toxin-antitoxin system RelE/ParE family toxin [Burkholderia sp. BCC1993]|uniref:type II toxin-antitoxin system RelE/ParE family toxin n=1 Tax=Burkholderia sp. BCC1993 TaxID=2817444 RepID=UPI002AAF8D14|nr:type II toxin-antitoxin system RelE/ParE family toxin [Burkholderia sp. BCC1993]
MASRPLRDARGRVDATTLPPPNKPSPIAAAKELRDLRAPPGNRLEALHGDREGQHSIRINERWRICFEWRDDGPAQVEIVDYH